MIKDFRKMIMGSAILASLSLFADLPQPFTNIQNLPQTPYFVQDAYVFYSLINQNNAAVVVDVESQDGGVAVDVAQQVSNLPSVQQIYSVNAWQSPDRSQKHLFQRFLSNVIRKYSAIDYSYSHGLSRSRRIAKYPSRFHSLVGANDQNTIYLDILAWYSHLSNNESLCGNNWNEPSIQMGVTKAAAMIDQTVQLNNNVWYFVKGS